MTSADGAQRWLQTILESKEVFSRICFQTFRRFDADRKGSLEMSEVSCLVREVSAQLGVAAPPEEKVCIFFATMDRSGTNSLFPNEFQGFFKGLLRSMQAQYFDKAGDDVYINVAALRINGETLTSVIVPPASTIFELKQRIADESELEVGFFDLTLLTDSEQVLTDEDTVGECMLGLQSSVQVITSEMYRWRCTCCPETNDAIVGLPLYALFIERCENCMSPAPVAALQTINRIKQEWRRRAVLKLGDLKKQIADAFARVQLGHGPSLHEAMWMDWQGDRELMIQNDERMNWQRIPEAAAVQASTGRCPCGCRPGSNAFQNMAGTLYPFNFFNEEAVRFHLPAYLIAAAEDADRAVELVEFGLDNDGFCMKCGLLNSQQRLAVATWIAYALEVGLLDKMRECKRQEILDCHAYWAG